MPVHMSKMSGKLKGIPAINTNTLTNLFCIRQHQKTDTICGRVLFVSNVGRLSQKLHTSI